MTNTDSTAKTDQLKAVFANLTESNRQDLTRLEQKLQEETGEKVALVAYNVH